MKLEINHTTVAEDANAKVVKQAMRDLQADDEAFIALHDGDNVTMEAAGIPEEGFAMLYNNKLTGVALTSTNNALKPVSVTRVLNHFLIGDTSWRQDIGWQAASAQASAAEKREARRRTMPVILSLLFFIIAYLPLVFGSNYVLTEVIFKPMCTQAQPNVSDFEHGSYGINIVSNEAMCWYEDGSNIPLEDIIGSSAVWLDFIAVIAGIIIPVIVIILILLVVRKAKSSK